MSRLRYRMFEMLTVLVSLLAALGVCGSAILAQEMSDQERIELSERVNELRIELNNLTQEFHKPADLNPIPQSLFQTAMDKGKAFLAVNRKLHGDNHASVVEALSWIAARCEDAEEFEKAHEAREDALAILITVHGPTHWKTSGPRRSLVHCDKLATLTKEERNHLKELRVGLDWISRFFSIENTISSLDALIEAQLELLGPEDSEYLASSYRRGILHLNMGNPDKGIEILTKVMNTEFRVLGQNHPDYGTTCYVVSNVYSNVGKYELARPYWQRAQTCMREAHEPNSKKYRQWCEQLCNDLQEHSLRAARKAEFEVSKEMLNDSLANLVSVFGEDDWRTKNARLSLEYLAVRQQMSEPDRNDLEQAERLETQSESEEQVPTAIENWKMAIGIRERIQGKHHRDYALAVLKMALLMQQNNQHAEAAASYKDAIPTLREVLTTAAEPYATACEQLSDTLHILALTALGTGDDSAAIEHLQSAVDCLRDIEPQSAGLGVALNNLGLHLLNRGDYPLALSRLHEALKCHEKSLGKGHPEYATTLHNLGLARGLLGDWAGSERALLEALRIREKVFGKSHPYYAQTLSTLAFRQEADEYERSWKQALEIARNHPEGDIIDLEPAALLNLGSHYWSEGNLKLAEEYLLEVEKYYGSRDLKPFALNALQAILANLYRDNGDMALSKKYLDTALQLVEDRFGTKHPRVAELQLEFAIHHLYDGNQAKATEHLKTAMTVAFDQLHQSMYGVSERQQLTARQDLESVLDLQFSLAQIDEKAAQNLYGLVYLSKGIVLQRQYLQRLARSDPSLLSVFIELEKVVSRLSHLALGGERADDPDLARRQVDELSEKVDELERKLSQRSPEFRVLAAEWSEHSRPQSLLPEGTVLVDFLEYSKSTVSVSAPKKLESKKHLLAFILRLNAPIAMKDLGPAEPIEHAVENWRKTLGDEIDANGTSPADELQRLVWQPLEPHLDGVDTLLVSPDGVLARIPFSALPGTAAGSYLVEQIAIATVPVPRMFFIDQSAAVNAPAQANKLLLVGDVDYGGPPGKEGKSRSAELKFRTGLVSHFDELKGTRGEILQIGDSFESSFANSPKPQALRRIDATEEAFRETAPACRWIHMATHGFFAPPLLDSKLGGTSINGQFDLQMSRQQGLSTFHPGLLSGLAMAGANSEANAELDDGILTALEVASIDLRAVELTVLSACETGLGEVAGGEGQLGLQRAFQVAGSRAVVASMWKVNDRATQQLMSDFYQNLWEKKMTKLEALRTAQIAMLKEGSRRGLGPALKDDEVNDEDQRLPPYYWAAFVLSGDFR